LGVGAALVYSTYLGGINEDRGNSIAVDNTGAAYVQGKLSPAIFPLKPHPYKGLLEFGLRTYFSLLSVPRQLRQAPSPLPQISDICRDSTLGY